MTQVLIGLAHRDMPVMPRVGRERTPPFALHALRRDRPARRAPRPPWRRRGVPLRPQADGEPTVGAPPFPGPGRFAALGGEIVCVDASDITDGTQVVVTDSSSHIISTRALAEDGSAADNQRRPVQPLASMKGGVHTRRDAHGRASPAATVG